MTKETYSFGSSVKRFHTLGIHPELLNLNPANNLGPGQYEPQRINCKYKKNAASWQAKLESEQFSKFLGFKKPQVLCDRLLEQARGGPGSYDLADYDKPKSASVFDNVGFGRANRFNNNLQNQTLPPGAHNLRNIKTKFSNLPTFEFDGITSRFKSTEPLYQQPPNRYTIKSNSITDKTISKRGPYDTFTGPRDYTTIKNHFASSVTKSPDKFYTIPSALDQLLQNPRKKRYGKFLVAERFPEGMTVTVNKKGFNMFEKDTNYASPATYSVATSIGKVKPNLNPFNCSSLARPFLSWSIHPGPDRYKIKYPKCRVRKLQKQSWMFSSKAERQLVKVKSYSNFTFK